MFGTHSSPAADPSPAQIERQHLVQRELERRAALEARRAARHRAATSALLGEAELRQQARLRRQLVHLMRRLSARRQLQDDLRRSARLVDDTIARVAPTASGIAAWRSQAWPQTRSALEALPPEVASEILCALDAARFIDVADDDAYVVALSLPLRMSTGELAPAAQIARGLESAASGEALLRSDAAAMVGSGDTVLAEEALLQHPTASRTLDPSTWNSQERAYLRARSEPRQLSDDEVSLLGWTHEARRRALLAGSDPARATGADPTAAPDEMDRLYRVLNGDLTAASEAITQGDSHSTVLEQFLATPEEALHNYSGDPSFWRLLDARVEGGIVGASTEFVRWQALHRLRHALHSRGPHAGRALLGHARSVGGGLMVQGEVEMIAAYIEVMTSNDASAWRAALSRVRKITDPRAAHNAELLTEACRRLKDSGAPIAREAVKSPFVVLGVDDAAPNWKARWKALRLEHRADEERSAELNWAKQRIERGSTHFVLPLNAGIYRPPLRGKLMPSSVPYPRETRGLTPRDVATWRAQANAALSTAALASARPTALLTKVNTYV